jgi:hypothetical protein
MKKIILVLFLISTIQLLISKADNTGQINGTVTDSISGEPLIGAYVYVVLNGTKFGTATDINGYFALKPLQPGMYDVKCVAMGFTEKTFLHVRVSQQSITLLNVPLSNSELPVVVITPGEDLIGLEPKNAIDAEMFKRLPSRDPIDAISTMPAVYQSDSGGELYFRGSRPEATEYYIDNMRVTGELGIPAGAIAEIMVYSGGIPARYGDVTGGVVVITTKSYNMYHE